MRRPSSDARATTSTHRIAKLGPPWVGSVEDGVQDGYRFLTPRAGLYADKGDLARLRDDIDARVEYEISKATGNLLDDEPPPAITAESVKKRFGLGGLGDDHYPDGYYQSKDGRVLVVAIRSKVMGTDLAQGREAIRRVREVLDGAELGGYSPPIRYGLQGDLWTGVAELTVVNEDLTRVGITGFALIGAVVFFYYLRFRALATMLLTIVVGVSWSFGFTELALGYLNLATGFLFTILAGNGINAGVILMARYLEARRLGADVETAVRVTHERHLAPYADRVRRRVGVVLIAHDHGVPRLPRLRDHRVGRHAPLLGRDVLDDARHPRRQRAASSSRPSRSRGRPAPRGVGSGTRGRARSGSRSRGWSSAHRARSWSSASSSRRADGRARPLRERRPDGV